MKTLKKIKKERKMPSTIKMTTSSMQQAYEIGLMTEKIDFDWSKAKHVMKKVYEEIDELKYEVKSDDKQRQFEELGDVLFTLVQLARHLKLDPDLALQNMNHKFIRRFNTMLKLSKIKPHEFKNLPAKDKELLWKKAKKKLG